MVGHRQGDRGHRHLEGDAVGLDAAQHLVEVEAAVQPDGGAGLGRGQQVEQAEDVRRAAWRPGSGRRGRGRGRRTSGAVAWPIERWVWRTALGSPVVPELKTRTASSVSRASRPRGRPVAGCGRRSTAVVAGSSRSVTCVAAERARRAARRRRRRRRRGTGAVSSSGVVDLDAPSRPGSAARRRRPSLLMACTATTNSTRLVVITATRSPGPTPAAGEVAGEGVGCRPSRSAKRPARRRRPGRRPGRRTGRPPARGRGACRTPPVIGNIVLH